MHTKKNGDVRFYGFVQDERCDEDMRREIVYGAKMIGLRYQEVRFKHILIHGLNPCAFYMRIND